MVVATLFFTHNAYLFRHSEVRFFKLMISNNKLKAGHFVISVVS